MQKNKKNKKERHGQPEKLYLVCHLIFIRSNKWQKNCLKINDNGKHKAAISCYMVSPYPMTIPLAHLKECLTRENCQRSLKKIENSFLVPVTGLQRKVRLLQYLNHCASFNQRMTFILVKTKLI